MFSFFFNFAVSALVVFYIIKSYGLFITWRAEMASKILILKDKELESDDVNSLFFSLWMDVLDDFSPDMSGMTYTGPFGMYKISCDYLFPQGGDREFVVECINILTGGLEYRYRGVLSFDTKSIFLHVTTDPKTLPYMMENVLEDAQRILAPYMESPYGDTIDEQFETLEKEYKSFKVIKGGKKG